MTPGGLRAPPILVKTILQILFNSHDSMRCMVSHRTNRVNVSAVVDTHDNRISMYPMEETKTISRCCAALMTTAGTWLTYRTYRGCASAVYISRDNWRSILSNNTNRDYAPALFNTQDNRRIVVFTLTERGNAPAVVQVS